MGSSDGVVVQEHPNPFGVIPGNPYRDVPQVNDPAFQPPRDPLKVSPGELEKTAKVILRDLPYTSVQTGWTVDQVRAALESLVSGNFDAPAQLVDAINGDSRVQSAMQSRVGGLMGREIRHQIPAHMKDSAEAKACHAAWVEHWPAMATEPVMCDMLSWGTQLGFHVSQLLWDTSQPVWKPYLSPFYARYTFYQPVERQLMAVTQDGMFPVTGGDGHWVLYAPNGRFRGWLRGAVRAIAPWWLARNYALRDWARYSERHGMPIGKAITPAGADKEVIERYRRDLQNLGQESILQCPQSADPGVDNYDFQWVETNGGGWQGFQQLIAQCNAEITLAVLGQNLTSEVKEGSFAAARVHADVRQAILESDARALAQAVYTQIARPFAAINFGDPELAPRTSWDIIPYEDNKALADTLSQFAIAVSTLKNAGYKLTRLEDFGRHFGLSLGVAGIEEVEVPIKTAAA